MGAKSAIKLRSRGNAYKCDVCGRKLMTTAALIIHQRRTHTSPKTETKPVIKKPIKKVKGKPKPKKKSLSFIKRASKVIEEEEFEDVKDEPKKPATIHQIPVEELVKRDKTVDFECPKCFRVFMTYFTAHKHIQKFHCVNKLGSKVPPNSPSLIQPVRIELCLKCKKKVKSIQTHVCEEVKEKSNQNQVYKCIECEDFYPNMKTFDIHVLSSHGNDVESMFFPRNYDFTKWKVDMESQTKVKYAVFDNYDSKKYYHCKFVKNHKDKDKTRYVCPSTIVIQEFSKGIQVHFYKQHYKHNFVEYSLSDKYKKFSITSYLRSRSSDEYSLLPCLAPDDGDMYSQLKALMEGVVNDAAKVNISTLRILLGKALEMTSVLANYDEECDENASSEAKNSSQTIQMNDTQISKVLEDSNSTTGKRKNDDEDNNIDAKRTMVEFVQPTSPITSSPKIINSFSLANNVDIEMKLNNDHESTDSDDKSNDLKPTKQLNEGEVTPSSFNDSYKDFVVKNFPYKDKRKRIGRPVKTKMGQFKPSSPKSVSDAPSITTPVKSPVNSKPVQAPVKQEVKSEPKKVNRLSVEKPKADFEYEVKEQEDGCNILILKI